LKDKVMGKTKVLLGALLYVATAAHAASPLSDHGKEHQYAGQIAFTQGNYDKAIHEFRKAIHDHPNSSEDWLWLARALGRKAENANPVRAAFMVGDIRRAFERSVELDPQNLEARADLMDFYLEAPAAFGGGVDKAREQADAIGRLNKGDGLLALSQIAEKEEKFALAERHLKAAAQLEPSPGRYRELGEFYHRRKNYPAMEEALRAAGDTKSLFYLAQAFLEQGRNLPEAEQMVNRYLAAGPPRPGDEPTVAQGRLLLGQIQERQGRPREAAREFRAALEANPNLKAAKKELEKVQ
jgi:tetratricopeptide (TPR) repeat protein